MNDAFAMPGQVTIARACPSTHTPPPSAHKAPFQFVAPLTLRRGTWFDPAMDLRDPEGEALAARVMGEIAAIEPRRRRLRPLDHQNRLRLVRAILANAYRCHFHYSSALVAYPRRTKGYPGHPSWCSGEAIARCVDLLTEAKLIDSFVGRWGESSSTFHIKPALFGFGQAAGVTVQSLTCHMPPEALLRVRHSNSKGPYAEFAHTGVTLRWTALLASYNRFLSQQHVAVNLTPQMEREWVDRLNSDRREAGDDGPRLTSPELFKTDLFRSFNNGGFEEGGRLYGGWWISVPKAMRRFLTINGNSTVELDYHGCAIRMLYHERGIHYPDDPYHLDPLAAHEAEADLGTKYYRGGVKALMQAIINGDPSGRPEMARLKSFSFKPKFSRPEIRAMLEAKHAPIADAFGTGAGLRLQRLDSELALTIITDLKDQGIAALPVHDAFIVAKAEEDRLRLSMDHHYKQLLSFTPVIKKI